MILLSALVLAIWAYLVFAPGRFWLIERDSPPCEPVAWPDVVAVIPARNEAPLIDETLRSLWAQDYPGTLHVVLVDDRSEDGTADAARQTAARLDHTDDLEVVPGQSLPAGWVGKVWAMQQGLERALSTGSGYILFCDADISHGPGSLRELIARAEAGCDLASFMVRLRCHSAAEKLMIPAFVYFFRMLYPFRRVNDPRDTLAGAAGGTMLLKRGAIERIGGLQQIRGALIDDCSLAREIKRGGHRIWLGLSETSQSTRGYGGLDEIVRMISRTAYTQLGYSPLRLLGCVAGLGITFLAAPALTVAGRGTASLLAGVACLLMCLTYAPMLRFYRRSPIWAVLLPLTATVYLWATIRSAWRYHRRLGAQWKTSANGNAEPG